MNWHGWWCDGQVLRGHRIFAGTAERMEVLMVNGHRGFTVQLLHLLELSLSQRAQPFLEFGRTLCEYCGMALAPTADKNFAVDLECALLLFGLLCTLSEIRKLPTWQYDTTACRSSPCLSECLYVPRNLRLYGQEKSQM